MDSELLKRTQDIMPEGLRLAREMAQGPEKEFVAKLVGLLVDTAKALGVEKRRNERLLAGLEQQELAINEMRVHIGLPPVYGDHS